MHKLKKLCAIAILDANWWMKVETSWVRRQCVIHMYGLSREKKNKNIFVYTTISFNENTVYIF